jgi:hypothetical protein
LNSKNRIGTGFDFGIAIEIGLKARSKLEQFYFWGEGVVKSSELRANWQLTNRYRPHLTAG